LAEAGRSARGGGAGRAVAPSVCHGGPGGQRSPEPPGPRAGPLQPPTRRPGAARHRRALNLARSPITT